MDIKALLPKSHFLLHLQAGSRRDLLQQLAAPLVEDGILTDVDVFVKDVLRREEQITTQIGKDLAIPHARSAAVRRLGISVGLADAPGIAFNPAAGKCLVFFLIAIPAFAPTSHLILLQGLVHFANERKRMDKLKAAATPAQAASALVTYKWPH